jgi:short-subunit dehydrogenase
MITGGNKGIGLEFATQLGHKGFNLLIVDLFEKHNKQAVENLNKIFNGKIKIDSVAGDINAIDYQKATAGKDISILLNNAGIA